MTDGLRVRRIVAGVLVWAVFGLTWSVALGRGHDGAGEGVAVLLLSAVAAFLITLVWQVHNKAIYRRKGPRRSSPLDGAAWQTDRLGHRLEFAPGLDGASEVVVGLSDGVKTYRVAS